VARLMPSDDVARFQQGHVDGRRWLRPGMRLDIGEVSLEQALGAIDGQLFGDVDEFTAA